MMRTSTAPAYILEIRARQEAEKSARQAARAAAEGYLIRKRAFLVKTRQQKAQARRSKV